jgi:glyoxylase-like metal-dependent hydrolase (beta-lactamase superfamily II)
MDGRITRTDIERATIHTYTSPIDGYLVNSHVIETDDALVLIDAQFARRYAREVADYVDGLNKPVNRIIISHAHPDHWFGLETISERFPSIPTFAFDEVREYIRENGQVELDAQQDVFGDDIATSVVVPNETLLEGEESIEGLRYRFEKYLEAEVDVQLAVSFPETDVLIAPDLVFASDQYVFIASPSFDTWIDVLEDIKQRDEVDQLILGHGDPTDPSAIDNTIAFLEDAREIYDRTDDHREYARRVKERYPTRESSEWVDLSAQLLYGVLS